MTDTPTPMERVTNAIAAWQYAMQTMALAERSVTAADPRTLDNNRTAMWEACDMLDAAVTELRDATMAVTEVQRREIRRARLMANFTIREG